MDTLPYDLLRGLDCIHCIGNLLIRSDLTRLADEVTHIIAAHAAEGDHVKRTTEAMIVHHADFMSYLPFKNL